MTLLLITLGCQTDSPERNGELLPLCVTQDTEALLIEHPALTPIPTGVLDEAQLTWPTLTWVLAGPTCEDCQADDLSLPVPASAIQWQPPMQAFVLPSASLPAGSWDLRIGEDEGWIRDVLFILPGPQLDTVQPQAICILADLSTLQLRGAGLLRWEDQGPALSVSAQTLEATSMDDCSPLAGELPGEVCTQASFQVDPSTIPVGYHSLFLNNPDPASCEPSLPQELQIVAAPTLKELEPSSVCEGGTAVTLFGEGLVPDSQVFANGEPLGTTWVSEGELTLDVSGLAVGSYDIEVQIDGECSTVFSEALQISDTPLVFFVDPPVIYPTVPTTATAYVADLTGDVEEVWIEDKDGVRSEVTWSAEKAGQVSFQPPTYLDPGPFTVVIAQGGSCEAETTGEFSVRRYSPIEIEALDPAYAWSFDRTAVVITATAAGSPFEATPRAYLMGPDRKGETYPLLGVSWRSGTQLKATVPEGMLPGSYSLMVLNPDESMGHLEDALQVSTDAPPRITTVTPGSLDKSSPEIILIQGRDFREPSVSLSCQEDGVNTTFTPTILSTTYAQIQAEVPATGLNGAVCVVDVQNADDSSARYSAISIRNPSQNLFPWQPGPDLVEARRAPAAAATRINSVDRYLLALGGDQGEVSSAIDSIEAAEIGVYGDIGPWSLVQQTLPTPLSGAAVLSLPPFIYLIGGDDGSGSTDGLYRAEVLDSDDAPAFTNVSLARKNNGLEAGTWTYKVAAVFKGSDLSNPKGESLPSQALALTLPDLGSKLLSPTLTWTAITNAQAYKVYRSPSADSGSDSEVLVAEVSVTSWSDTGAVGDTSKTPKGPGAIGEWKAFNSLNTARSFHCAALAYDPEADPEFYYLYAAGGLDDSGEPLDSIEYIKVRKDGPKDQTTGAWKVSANTLGTARYGCGAYTVDATAHSVVDADESWLYFSGGATKSSTTGETYAGLVLHNGELGEWQEVDSMSPARAGFAYASANNSLYAFGGKKGEVNGTSVSAEIDGVPQLANWNSLSIGMWEDRVWAGSAQESAVITVVGGTTNSDAASRSTEWTNY